MTETDLSPKPSWIWGIYTIDQCLALYLEDPGKFSMVFPIVFQASTGKKLREKNHGKNHGTHKFDAKHFAIEI